MHRGSFYNLCYKSLKGWCIQKKRYVSTTLTNRCSTKRIMPTALLNLRTSSVIVCMSGEKQQLSGLVSPYDWGGGVTTQDRLRQNDKIQASLVLGRNMCAVKVYQ